MKLDRADLADFTPTPAPEAFKTSKMCAASGADLLPEPAAVESDAAETAPSKAAAKAAAKLAAKTERERERANRERAEADAAKARESGFVLQDTVFAIGTPVVAVGVENAERSRLEHKALPDATVALAKLRDEVIREDRSDVAVRNGDLVMSDDGMLEVPGVGRCAADPGAYCHAWFQNGMRGANWLLDVPASLRAVNHNTMMNAETIKDTVRVYRTRTRANIREVFAIVSERYTPFDIDEVADALKDTDVAAAAKADIVYDGKRALIDLTFHSDVDASDYVCGEVFKAGVRISTSDVGLGSLRVEAYVIRNLCLNLIVLDNAKIVTANARHLGAREALVDALNRGVAEGHKAISGFLKAWGAANTEVVVAPTDIPFEQQVLGVVTAFAERSTAVAKSDIAGIVKRYCEDEVTGSTLTRAGVVNAITRYAHHDVSDRWSAAALERAAGGLTFEQRPLQYAYVQMAA